MGDLQDLLALVTQSDPTVGLYEFEWTWIFNPHSFRVGACGVYGRIPVNITGDVGKRIVAAWRSQEYTGMPINCIIWTIVYETTGDRRLERFDWIRKRAWKVQQDLGWDATPRPFKDVYKILRLPEYSKIRVTFLERWLGDYTDNTFKGPAFAETHQDLHNFSRRSGAKGTPTNCIYIGFDRQSKHCGPYAAFKYWLTTARPQFCHACLHAYSALHACHCDKTEEERAEFNERKAKAKRLRLSPKCVQCGKRGCKCKYQRGCTACGSLYESTQHRCLSLAKVPVDESNAPRKQFFLAGQFDREKPEYTLWTWDCESTFDLLAGANGEPMTEMSFDTSDDGTDFLRNADGTLQIVRITRQVHRVNLVKAYTLNDGTGQPAVRTWRQADCDNPLLEFAKFMTVDHNEGYNICFAHNASGYDSRLLFEALVKAGRPPRFDLLCRGSKQLQLIVGDCRTYFRDSYLFLQGSLASLAKEMFPGEARKGFYPYFFNTDANNAGDVPRVIPPVKCYDLTSFIKSPGELTEFLAWHAAETLKGPVWCPQTELEAYCENDVKILMKCMMKFHDAFSDLLPVSPFYYATLPAFVSKAIRMMHYPMLELETTQPYTLARTDAVRRLTETEWVVNTPYEYYFARQALYGGRTDFRRMRCVLTDEERRLGFRICYYDFKSLYPYCQLAHEYPVGPPVVVVYDKAYTPCWRHDRLRPDGVGFEYGLRNPSCKCTQQARHDALIRHGHDVEYVEGGLEDHIDHMIERLITHVGFVGVDCTPPRTLFHPVLLRKRGAKTVASLEPFKEYIATTEELATALGMRGGSPELERTPYRIDRVYVAHYYRRGSPIWRDFLEAVVLLKERNGSNPSPVDQERITRGYATKFGIHDLRFPWAKNAALRKCYKIGANCGWGKECQNPNLPKLEIFTPDDTDAYLSRWDEADAGERTMLGFTSLPSAVGVKSHANPVTEHIRLNDFYLPAGVFVPAYGRLTLFKALAVLGDSVLYHDTDSVIFKYDPSRPDRSLATGPVLGDLEEDSEAIAHGGIVEFYAIAPKSYALVYADGTDKVVMKGVALRHAHRRDFTARHVAQMVTNFLDHHDDPGVEVPQVTFRQTLGDRMETVRYFKRIRVNPADFKGQVDPFGVLFPEGFCHKCLPGHPCSAGHYA